MESSWHVASIHHQGPRILPFDFMVIIPISSQLQNCPVLLACPRNPLWGFNAEFTSFINFSWRIPEAQSFWRRTTKWFFPVELEDLSLIGWILSISEKSLAWLFIPNCWWVNVAPLFFPETSEGPGLTCPGSTTPKLGSYQLNRGWIEPRKKTKQKPYFTWNTELF